MVVHLLRHHGKYSGLLCQWQGIASNADPAEDNAVNGCPRMLSSRCPASCGTMARRDELHSIGAGWKGTAVVVVVPHSAGEPHPQKAPTIAIVHHKWLQAAGASSGSSCKQMHATQATP
jgi:hypothetical protein